MQFLQCNPKRLLPLHLHPLIEIRNSLLYPSFWLGSLSANLAFNDWSAAPGGESENSKGPRGWFRGERPQRRGKFSLIDNIFGKSFGSSKALPTVDLPTYPNHGPRYLYHTSHMAKCRVVEIAAEELNNVLQDVASNFVKEDEPMADDTESPDREE
eukprot:2063737-Pyramimonas_sp.AAC.3